MIILRQMRTHMKKAQLLTSALLVSGVFALTACGDKKPADQAGANAAPPAPTINTIQKIKDSGKVVDYVHIML